MIEKIKNKFLGIITIFLLALLFLISPSFKFSKYDSKGEVVLGPYMQFIIKKLELVNYKLLDRSYTFQNYNIPRLVFNAYPEMISFKDKLYCYSYDIEVNTNEVNKIKEKLMQIKIEQKKEFDDYIKSKSFYNRYDPIYFYSVPFLKNGKFNSVIANKYIDLCASENSLAKIKEPNAEILGDFDFVDEYSENYENYAMRAYPVLISKGPVKSRLKIIIFDGLDWWYYVKFSR
jgi:hypothetical protein